MKTISDEHLQLLAEVAQLYYEQSLDQADIAKSKGVSRSSVSRLLTEARELGVIEFRINFPIHRHQLLEDQLMHHFDLESVHVLNTELIVDSQVFNRLGRLAAMYVQPLITSGTIIGVTWGRTVYEITTSIARGQMQDVKIVQVIGASGHENSLVDGVALVQNFAERLGAQHHYLHSPLMVENPAVRDAILSDPNIQRTLNLARQANILLTGIGTIDPAYSAPLRAGYINHADLIAIAKAGAIGEFCGYHINFNGELVAIPQNECIVGLTLDEIHNIPLVVGVGNGLYKAACILGALRGKHINAVITDDVTAREVIRIAGIHA
ncbi:MAG: sugar-binding transcriptional regulator [Anaerolineae bacterium]|nr:sugar-binding transcriptional regulator [Anaerolineae bacterium]